jgi:RNA polymerase sigma-70 factor (ECF subfamily)
LAEERKGLREPRTEEALMAAYAAGDKAAFQSLFQLLAPRVHGFFLRKFGDPALADDLLQVTFMKVHRARASYRRDAAVRPWIFTIAARVRLDELRRRGRQKEDANSPAIERITDVAVDAGIERGPEAIARKDTAALVHQAIVQLPESQREVIHLHRFEGLTLEQIAQVLGTTEGAVKLRAFRAYERLRQQLAPVLREMIE